MFFAIFCVVHFDLREFYSAVFIIIKKVSGSRVTHYSLIHSSIVSLSSLLVAYSGHGPSAILWTEHLFHCLSIVLIVLRKKYIAVALIEMQRNIHFFKTI